MANTMTEETIERTVEARTNTLDRMLILGVLSQSEYETATEKLNQWAEVQYARLPRRPDLESV